MRKAFEMWEINQLEIIRNSKSIESGSLYFSKEGIVSEETAKKVGIQKTFNGNGFRAYPGLVNSHDHLLASYLPKIGVGSKHQNWLSFDNLYKASGIFAERQQLDSELLYYLGAYKNAFSGVSTVSDHIPHFVNSPFEDILPIRFLTKYRLAHSVGSYSLGWGEGIALEYQLAEKENVPFIVHLGEGIDEDSKMSLRNLIKANGLGSNSVLIHCLPFGQKEAEDLKSANSTVVWCPTSNIHIFGKTTNIQLFLKSGINLCLGTDFSPSGALNLWEEMRFAKKIYYDLYSEELSDQVLFQWVTENPAKAFRLPGTGELVEGSPADFFLLPKSEQSPYSFYRDFENSQISLFFVRGEPIWGNQQWKSIFDHFSDHVEAFSSNGMQFLVSGRIMGLWEAMDSFLGFKKDLAFFPMRRN